jgi:hypothetical protein
MKKQESIYNSGYTNKYYQEEDLTGLNWDNTVYIPFSKKVYFPLLNYLIEEDKEVERIFYKSSDTNQNKVLKTLRNNKNVVLYRVYKSVEQEEQSTSFICINYLRELVCTCLGWESKKKPRLYGNSIVENSKSSIDGFDVVIVADVESLPELSSWMAENEKEPTLFGIDIKVLNIDLNENEKKKNKIVDSFRLYM